HAWADMSPGCGNRRCRRPGGVGCWGRPLAAAGRRRRRAPPRSTGSTPCTARVRQLDEERHDPHAHRLLRRVPRHGHLDGGADAQAAAGIGMAGADGAAGADGPEHGVPVLYLLHGLSDDCTIWERRTSIERYATEKGIA